MIGKRFHELTVLKKAGSNRQGSITWECLCDCGNTKVYSTDHLTRKTCPVKSCGCRKKKHKGKDHHQWTGVGDISGGWFANHVTRERKQNTRTKVPVTITIEYIWNLFLKQDRKCSLSGTLLKIGQGAEFNASIDRIDSSKGYIEGNVQWVDKHVNFMKRTYSQEFFIDMCKKIAEYNR